MIAGKVIVAGPGMRGFDANSVITPAIAKRCVDHGYQFCARYVRRKAIHTFDLSTKEANDILSAGLGLMVVQHVAPDGWIPTAELGATYGAIAVAESQRIGVPSRVMLWCDLEGVSTIASPNQVDEYCRAWYAQLATSGYEAGLYVGWRPGLNGRQLYLLPFKHYWGAYNVDVVPSVRGFQMKQSVMKERDRIEGIEFDCDVDTIVPDVLGGLPTLLVAQ